MIYYQDSNAAYQDIAQSLVKQFAVDEVAMISMGSLTYTKSVMRTIRKRNFKSKILQMPFQQVAGKYAYPAEIKIDLFKNLYTALANWQEKVFFYLCMEPEALWAPVFGDITYPANDDFEQAMKIAYMNKIKAISGTQTTLKSRQDKT